MFGDILLTINFLQKYNPLISFSTTFQILVVFSLLLSLKKQTTTKKINNGNQQSLKNFLNYFLILFSNNINL